MTDKRKEKSRRDAAKWRARHPEQSRANAQRWRETHPEEARAVSRASHEKYKDVYKERYRERQLAQQRAKRAAMTPEQKKDRDLRSKYGITLVDYNQMWEQQGGLCAICLTPFTVRPPHVDHDHATLVVRSILCQHCNQAVGMVFEKPVVADRLAAYLRKHGKK